MNGRKRQTLKIIALLLLAVALAGCALSAGGGPAVPFKPTAVSPSATATPARAPGTVEFIVTGSAPAGEFDSATVTYGPAGTSLSGTVPMDVKATIPAAVPDYYDLQCQLGSAGGDVTVEILVNHVVIATGRATGADNLADATIMQDPFSGKWVAE